MKTNSVIVGYYIVKEGKTYGYFRFGAFALMAVYLAIAATHLFLAPRFQADGNITHNSIFKRNDVLVYNLIRTDRCMFNDNENVKTVVAANAASFISLFDHSKALPAFTASNFHSTPYFPDHHSAYLSNRILRI